MEYLSRIKEKSILLEVLSQDLRYIAYAGGASGWYKMQGMPATELPNNYRFFAAIDEKAFARIIGLNQKMNRRERRRFPRFSISRVVETNLGWGGEDFDNLGVTIESASLNGMKIVFKYDENQEIALSKGDMVNITIVEPSRRAIKRDFEARIAYVMRDNNEPLDVHMGLVFSSSVSGGKRKDILAFLTSPY